MNKVNVHRFDPMVAKNHNIVIIGKRATGKTILVQDLLTKFQMEKNLGIITPYINEYDGMEAYGKIYGVYENDVVDNFINQNVDVIVFDDCLYDTKWSKHKSLENCFMSKKINVFLSIGYPLGLHNSFKSNIGFTFIFQDSYEPNKKRIFKQYCAHLFETFEQFLKVFDNITQQKYVCFVIKNKRLENEKIEDCIFWYQADLPWRRMVNEKRYWLDKIRQELMEKTWHPSRIQHCLDYKEFQDIFQEKSDQ
jgi:hypothetical protein